MSGFWSEFTLDEYDRRARLQPALVVALPVIFSGLVWFPEAVIGLGTLASLLAYGGGAALLVQFGRDMGKKKERWLFQQWGGKPTTKLLRHREQSNEAQLSRRHRKLDRLVPDVDIPTPEEEAEDPEKADEIYETCVSVLRKRTLDNDLVFAENCNYGFRRNLWGMKPIGLTLSSLGIAVTGSKLLSIFFTGGTPGLLSVSGVLINVGLVTAWIFLITPSWVQLAADAYASQLLSTLDETSPRHNAQN